jgi:hypothetical protein
MRKIYLLLLVLVCQLAVAQQNVGIGVANPDPSAILDLTSTTKGFLIPRMSAVDRLAIIAPATGLLVFDTDTGCLFMYTGTVWNNMCVSSVPNGTGYNQNIVINPNGTISVTDAGGTLTTPQSAWLTVGNIGTNAANNFVGTTDAQDLVLKSNNTEVARITQSVAMGINQPAPAAGAILDIVSATKGILVPRTTIAQIAAPSLGLMIFDTDTDCFVFYNGATWTNLCGKTGYNYSVAINPTGTVSVTDGGGTQTSPQAAWITTGNSGTNAANNFAGTTDAQDFVLKSSNAEVMRLTTQGAMGVNQPAPAPAAIVDIVSTTKGILVPRTRIAQIAAPVLGLMIFDLDSNCYVLYQGASWLNLCNSGSGYNDSIYFNPNGTVSVLDGGGTKTSPQGAWETMGNAGTNSAVNYAGTTDAQDFVLRSNAAEVMRVTQQGAVGINQPAPNATAILDINSTAKGVLFPSLTQAQVDAIAGPAIGLTVYNNTLNVHQFWNGTCWVNVGQTVCSFVYTESISHPSDCLLRTNFNSVADTITISLVSGTPAPVILSASGVPAGVLVNFSTSYVTPTATSIITFTALPSAAVGTYTITILCTSGSTIQTLTYTLTVYDYNLSVNPPSATVNQIGIAPNVLTATTNITIGNPGACGAAQTTAILSVSGLPNGVTANFGNTLINIPGGTTLTFTSSSCAVVGTYTVQVVATIGVISTSTSYTLIVAPSVLTITANTQNENLFTLAGTPPCPIELTVNINAGVTIGSSNTGQPALTTGPFASGSSITINNNGTIAGAGGNGGSTLGDNGSGSCPNINGLPGGNALDLACQGVIINNTGTIGGGGGGGGAGADLSVLNQCTTSEEGASGGGGAGSVVGIGGPDQGCGGGANGTLLTGGAPGNNPGCSISCTILFFNFGPFNPGPGGAGGNLGQPGGNGGAANGPLSLLSCSQGNGGAPGCGIKTNGNLYTLNGPPPVGITPTCP